MNKKVVYQTVEGLQKLKASFLSQRNELIRIEECRLTGFDKFRLKYVSEHLAKIEVLLRFCKEHNQDYCYTQGGIPVLI